MAKTQETRSVPKLQFTDAEAGALEFPSSKSRRFSYFSPKKRKATLYEDVTVDVQPDPGRYLIQGWVYGFADGEGGYPSEWTALEASDWHRFRDPNEEWERTIYQNNSNVVRQIQQNIENAKKADAFNQWSRAWLKTVEQHLGAWMHVEHGLGMHVFLPAQRDAPSNMINNAISVNSMHKLRFAQDLALYNLDIDEEVEDFVGSKHKEVWTDSPEWQYVREMVESLTAVKDWAEATFAANIVFEPLVGEVFRSHFIMQVAAPNGDYVTPTVVGAGENDYERDLRYTRELFNLLFTDETHGEANKQVANHWVAQWAPSALQAVRNLQPVWSQPQEKPIRFEESLDRGKESFLQLLQEFGLEPPKEVKS